MSHQHPEDRNSIALPSVRGRAKTLCLPSVSDTSCLETFLKWLCLLFCFGQRQCPWSLSEMTLGGSGQHSLSYGFPVFLSTLPWARYESNCEQRGLAPDLRELIVLLIQIQATQTGRSRCHHPPPAQTSCSHFSDPFPKETGGCDIT